MNKVYAFILLTFTLCLNIYIGHAQSLVSTEPRNRTIVMEEFTGLNCGYCPDGHKIASGLKSKYNGEPILINIHVGSFSTPGVDQPDYRTAFGSAIDAQAQVTGYPSGTVNRLGFPKLSSVLALNRGQWEAATAEVVKMSSPVNVGLQSSFDVTTRTLTVDVELYYTSDAGSASNNLNVVLSENDVIGYQSDYTNGSQKQYHHMHMLRHMLTGQWGDVITTTTKGNLVKKKYTYVVPNEFNVANCEIAAFVGSGKTDIYSGAQVVADGGTTMNASAISTVSTTVVASDKLQANVFAAMVTNKLKTSEMFTFKATSNTPKGWVGKILINNVEYTGAEVEIDANIAKNISVSLSPESVPGVGSIEVTVRSKTYPHSPVVKQTFYLMSGVTDLLLSHPDAVKYDSVYTESMSDAKIMSTGMMNRNVFEKFTEANAFTGVKNLYYNVSWAFPGLTEISMNGIKALLDKGVNVMVAGQDFAWDVASGDTNANGNSGTKEFLNTYLMTKFINDGTSSNSLLTAIQTAPIFGTILNSTITNPYGGNNLYPEQIEPLTGATASFNYNKSATKIGGLFAYRNGYKVVYLGVGLEQLSSITRNAIMEKTSKWFNGEISNVDFEDMFTAKVSVYPIPATNQITVDVPEQMVKGVITIYSTNGNRIKEIAFDNQKSLYINTEDMPNGAYRINVENIYGGKIAIGMISIIR